MSLKLLSLPKKKQLHSFFIDVAIRGPKLGKNDIIFPLLLIYDVQQLSYDYGI
jgi:hypothetical protein